MKKLKSRIAFFLCLETFLYLTFLYFDLNIGTLSNFTSIIKYISILLCLVFSITEGIRRQFFSPLTVALAFAAIADVFLLFTQHFSIGVFFFLCVQTCYCYVISGKKSIPLILILCGILATFCLSAMLILNISLDLTIILVTIYFCFLLTNTINSCFKAITSKQICMCILTIAIVLLLLCDVNVGIQNIKSYINFSYTPTLTTLLKFSHIGIWLFYLPSQVLITLLSMNLKYGHVST